MKTPEPSVIVKSFGPGTTSGMTTLITSPAATRAKNAIVKARARAISWGGGIPIASTP